MPQQEDTPAKPEDRTLDEVYSGMRREEVFQKTNPMLRTAEDSVFQSQWQEATAYKEERDYVTTMLADPENLGGVAPNIVNAAQTHFDGQRLKDTAVAIRATALLLNRKVEDLDASQLPAYMKGVAAQLGKPEPKTIGAYRTMLSNHFVGVKKREDAFTDLTQKLVADQLFSAQNQEQTLAAKDVGRTLATWFEENPEMSADPSKHWMIARSANEFSQRMLKEIAPVKAPAAQTFQTLVNFTQGKTDPDQLSDLAMTLGRMKPEERQKVYQFTAIAAQANQIDRKALSQFAMNLGQSFSRGFDFIPQTVLRDKEGGVSGWINAIKQGVQVWVPTDGDLSQASVGNAPDSAMREVMEEGTYRLASPEERETLLKSGDNAMEAFQIERELRNLAKSSVDPIRELTNGGLFGAMERGAYGLSGSIPLMGATAIHPFVGIAAYQAMEYDRIRLNNPDLSLTAANSLALIEGAGNAAIDKLQLMGLAGRSPMLAKTMQGMKSGGILNYLKRVGLIQLEQFTQENIQDLIAPVVEGIAASIREDMPGTDFARDVQEYFNTRPEVFFAVLPLALVGGGYASANSVKNPAATFTREAMRSAGFSDQSIEYVFSAQDPEQLQQRIQEEWKKRTPENIAKGIDLSERRADAAKNFESPYTLAVDETPSGESVFVVTDKRDGTEVLRTPDLDAAWEIIGQRQAADITNERQSISELFDWATRILKDPKVNLDAAPQMVAKLKEQFETKGDKRALQELRQRIVDAGFDPDGDLTGIGVFGETTIEQVRDGVYRAVISLAQDANLFDAFEEIGHGFDKVALAEGRVSLEQFAKWLEQTEQTTGKKFNRGNATEILESMARLRQDWVSGKIEDTSLPSAVLAYLKKIALVLQDAILRFSKIQAAMESGQVDKSLGEYLDESLGISPQTKMDRIAEEEAAILEPSRSLRGEQQPDPETPDPADDPATEAGTPAPDVDGNELNPEEQNGPEWRDIPWTPETLYSVKVLPTAFPNMDKATADKIMAASPDGKIRSVYIDRMKAGGEYLGIDLQGGMFFPAIVENLKNGVAWAFNSVGVAKDVYERAMKQGGYLILSIMQEGNIIGNKTFTYIWFKQLEKNIRAGKLTKDDALAELNRVRERWLTKEEFIKENDEKVPVLDKEGNPTVDEKGKPVYKKRTVELTGHTKPWTSLAQAKKEFLSMSQITRGNTYFQKGWDKKRGIATYGELLTIKNANAGFPDAKQLVSDLEEPSFKGLPAQTIVAVIQIDKVPEGQNPVLTADQAGVTEHLSYKYVLKGKPVARMTKFKTLASLNPKIKNYMMSQDQERWDIKQAVSYSVRQTKLNAREIKQMVDSMSADQLRKRLANAKLTTTQRMAAMLGEFPEYLEPIVGYMMDKRADLVEGKVSPRDVAKAYWMTIASIGADAINVSTIAAKAEANGIAFDPDPLFLTVGKNGQMKMRPEELAAYWLGTPEGQRALDNVERGEFNPDDWETGLILRDAFGRNDLRDKWSTNKKGEKVYKSGAVGGTKGKKTNLTKLAELTERINEAKGDPEKLEKAVTSAVGIGEGKKGFIAHFLGFGEWSTIDAVELNVWLTGSGDTTRAPQRDKIITAIAKKASGSKATQRDLFARIRKAIVSMQKKAEGGDKVPSEVAPHIIHHWIWDAAKDIQTTHEGLYHAMKNYSIRTVTPEQDSEFLRLAKDPEANQEQLQEMVDETARSSPFNIGYVYHGTDVENITEFETDDSDRPSGRAAFFSGERNYAANFGDYEYKAFLKIENAKEIGDIEDRVTPLGLSRRTGINRNEIDSVYEAKEKMALFEWFQEPDILHMASKNHDALVGREDGHPVYLIFNSNQIKSADPVTYDADGNVIPLSQRFNPDSTDINYSIRKVDESGIEDNIEVLNREPEERLALYDRAKQRFLDVIRRNSQIVEDAISEGATPEATRKLQLQQAIAELEGIFRVLPKEMRNRVGGFARLANIAPMDVYKDGTKISEAKNRAGAFISAWMREGDSIGVAMRRTELPPGYTMQENFDTRRTDQALAQFFKERVGIIDRQLERLLRREYDIELQKVWKRSKPKKNQPGERPKGIGAEIQRMFADLKVISELSEDETRTRVTAMQDLIDTGDLSPADEAYQRQLMGLANLVGNWKEADASRRASAVKALRDTWSAAYANFKVDLIREAARLQDMMEMATIATGKWGDDYFGRKDKSRKAAKGWGRFNSLLSNVVSFDGLMRLVFGEKSPIAQQFSDGQRKADNDKEDGVQGALQEIEDLFVAITGDRAKAEKLRYEMMQPTVKLKPKAKRKKGELSQLEAITATMMWMQEDGKRHMTGHLDEEGDPSGSWNYDQEWVDEVEKQLTPEARKLRLFLLDKYRTGWYPLNEVYKKINGVDLPQITNYSPMSLTPKKVPANTSVDVSGQPIGGGVNFGNLMNRGTAIAEPDFKDALQIYIAHTKSGEHFKAYAPFMHEVGKVLKNRTVQNAIAEAIGPEAPKVLNAWLTALAQGGNRDASLGLEFSQIGSDMLGRATQMALVGRIGTLFIQTTQLAAASAEMPTGAYIVRLSKLLTGNLAWGAAINSKYIQRRIKQLPPVVQEAMRGLAADKPNAIKRTVQLLGNTISGVDGLFTAGTFAILYDYHLNQAETSLGLSRKQAEEYAEETAERITDRLAQPTRMGGKSIIEVTNTNPAWRVAFAFASEPRKNLALLSYAIAKRPAATKLRTLGYLFLGNALFGAVIRNAWRDARDKDDDEWFDEKNWSVKRLLVAALSDPLMGIPVFGEVLQEGIYKMTGEYYNNSDLLSIGRGVTALGNIPDTLSGDRDMNQILGDLNAILGIGGLFNQNIAAITSLSTVAKDVFGAGENTIKMATE